MMARYHSCGFEFFYTKRYSKKKKSFTFLSSFTTLLQADIWSLAITAIEMAVGEPPHCDVHPMRAIFLIPQAAPPTLPDPENWSDDFNDFLKVCLVKDPSKRPSAEYLLTNHPFITKSKNKALVSALVDECMQQIDDYREAEGLEDEGDEEGGREGDAAQDVEEDHPGVA